MEEPALEEPALEEPALEMLTMDKQALEEPSQIGSIAAPMTWPRRPRGWLQVGLAMMAMLCLARQERLVMGFIGLGGHLLFAGTGCLPNYRRPP
jgi:hypothetical protein